MGQTHLFQAIRRVVVANAGGGTAGWLAANHLAKNLGSNSQDGV